MIHLKGFEAFIKESRGQRIGLRRTNRPYDPNDNEFTKMKDSRQQRLMQMKASKLTDELRDMVKRLAQSAIKVIDCFKNADAIMGNSFPTLLSSDLGIFFYDEATGTSTSEDFFYVGADEEGVKYGVYVENETRNFDQFCKWFAIEPQEHKDEYGNDSFALTILSSEAELLGDMEPTGEVILDDSILTPMIRVFISENVHPSGLIKMLKANGFDLYNSDFDYVDEDAKCYEFKVSEIDRFVSIVNRFFSKY